MDKKLSSFIFVTVQMIYFETSSLLESYLYLVNKCICIYMVRSI